MPRTVQIRAGDYLASKIRTAVEGTRLTYDGFVQPGKAWMERHAAAQRKLWESLAAREQVERVMAFYRAHPIDPQVLKQHDSAWHKQTYMRAESKPASTGATVTALLLLGYTLRGKRHTLTEHAEFYAPGAAPAEAVEETEVAAWGTGKDAAVKKANQRRKKRERDAAVKELEQADQARRSANANYNEKYRKVHGKNPPKVKELEDASSRMWLSRTHWDMVAAGLFRNRDGLAHLDAYLCAHAKSNVPASERTREDWEAKVPSPQEAAAALGKDPRNVRTLYLDLMNIGRLRLKNARYAQAYLITWRDRDEMRHKLGLSHMPDVAPSPQTEDEHVPAATGA